MYVPVYSPSETKWGLSFILLYFSAVFPTYRVCPTDMWPWSNNSGGVHGEAALVQSTSQELGLLTSCDKKEKSEVLVLNELIDKWEEEVKLLRTYYAWSWLGIWYKLSNLVLTKTLQDRLFIISILQVVRELTPNNLLKNTQLVCASAGISIWVKSPHSQLIFYTASILYVRSERNLKTDTQNFICPSHWSSRCTVWEFFVQL